MKGYNSRNNYLNTYYYGKENYPQMLSMQN